MKSKILDQGGERGFVLVFQTGDEVAAGLLDFAKSQQLTAAHFTAIGAFREVTLGWYNLEKQDYEKIPIREQVEVLSLVGNVALDKDKPKVHAHVVVGKRDGTAHGGHLVQAIVRPTLEVMLFESPAALRRQMDPAAGLALISLE
ncbi:MAG TPA: PPC domain-containing DNA-binding protein [Pirellulales bacterium]|nr:PPC domain-containing DNA-binding protein [Pirellulales bacterium]